MDIFAFITSRRKRGEENDGTDERSRHQAPTTTTAPMALTAPTARARLFRQRPPVKAACDLPYVELPSLVHP